MEDYSEMIRTKLNDSLILENFGEYGSTISKQLETLQMF